MPVICDAAPQSLQFCGPDTPGIWVQTGREAVAVLCNFRCATLLPMPPYEELLEYFMCFSSCLLLQLLRHDPTVCASLGCLNPVLSLSPDPLCLI